MTSPWAAYQDFHHFIDAQLRQLLRDHGYQAWLLTRVQGKQQQVLAWQSHGNLPMLLGQQLDWQQCHARRVLRENLSPLMTNTDPAGDPFQTLSGCNSLIALPLLGKDQQPLGAIYGLSGRDTKQEPEAGACLLHQAKVIAYCLQQALEAAREQRVQAFMNQTELCPETGVLNHRGWRTILDQEQARVRHLGEQSTLLSLSPYPDSDPVTIADSLAALLRSEDAIAHLDDGDFSVALPHTNEDMAKRVAERIKDALNAKGILVETRVQALRAVAEVQPG